MRPRRVFGFFVGTIRFFDDRHRCVCSSFLRRCSNCFFTEISFSNSGLARAKLNSAVPGGALQVPRSRWPRWFRCSHVSLCCSSLLSRCSYHFFTWAPFHSGHGWTPDSALLPRRFLYVVLACGRVRMIQRSCRFGRQGRLPAPNSYHPCTPDVCMRRL